MRANQQDPLMTPETARKYYFLQNSHPQGTTSAVRDADGDPVLEDAPRNSNAEEFAPRPLGQHGRQPSVMMQNNSNRSTEAAPNFLSKFLFGSQPGASSNSLKPRKAPIKIEPKVFFANERTFLAWMHLSVVLAGASLAILALTGDADDDSNRVSQLYGVILLPVAVAFIVYSMYQYNRRARMIRHRHPGPYEDTVGPTVLGIMLMVSITAQFALKLYTVQQQQQQLQHSGARL